MTRPTRVTVREAIGKTTKARVVDFERRAKMLEALAIGERNPLRAWALRDVASDYRLRALLMRQYRGSHTLDAKHAIVTLARKGRELTRQWEETGLPLRW